MKMDLLCSINIIPRTIIIKPMITNDLLTDLFRFINYVLPKPAQFTLKPFSNVLYAPKLP